jgi:hypothetical protein
MVEILKTLRPGRIGTHDILFRWRRQGPLHHAAKATKVNFQAMPTLVILIRVRVST